ncbi:GNAT family N-acetyltransferase [Halieaceae bacterium]|nr:GNAT family N-acetyltransferase [Halieaceae bacterium]
MQVQFHSSIIDIDGELWNGLFGKDYPFTRHEFLLALETSGCTNKESGWQPFHLVISDDHNNPLAALPLFLKGHSYGEYIFDWSWADAYRRSGKQYYPKFLSAIPFTPATGPRLGFSNDVTTAADREKIINGIIKAIKVQAESSGISSWHVLYPDLDAATELVTAGLPLRHSSQFHWFNDNFESFDDFLATFNSRKRKSLKRERRRVEEQSVSLDVIEGEDISAEQWLTFYHFYQITYAKRSGHGGYLNQGFFREIAATMPEHIIMVLAKHDGEHIAGALYFRSSDTLFGRYWGCTEEVDCLHFEACYYQGIEYCIKNDLKKFDPGAQGEHKIQRGFRPVKTYSNHWIADPDFREAIADFTLREAAHIDAYIEDAGTYLPFKNSIE